MMNVSESGDPWNNAQHAVNVNQPINQTEIDLSAARWEVEKDEYYVRQLAQAEEWIESNEISKIVMRLVLFVAPIQLFHICSSARTNLQQNEI